jgi:hypothetical protein
MMHLDIKAGFWNTIVGEPIVVYSHEVRTAKHKMLGFLVKDAKKACEAGKEDDVRSWGLDEVSSELDHWMM